MEKVRYMISDAARMVALEQHVLRYWEDELQLDIPRNEMGHRYYTDDNIKEILRIKDLREKGYQLKAIRMYLKKEKRNEEKEQEARKKHVDLDGFVTLTSAKELGFGEDVDSECAIDTAADTAADAGHMISRSEESQVSAEMQEQARIRVEQFQKLMTEIVANAMRENNEVLTTHVEERILKEMNYLMQEHYQLEEDHYKKLDEAIRSNLRKKRSRGVKWILPTRKSENREK